MHDRHGWAPAGWAAIVLWPALWCSAALAAAPDRTDASDQRPPAQGSDWLAFLGPTGDSKSTERGVFLHWPARPANRLAQEVGRRLRNLHRQPRAAVPV